MLTYDTPALRQTGSRNPTGQKTLPTIWGTYMKLVTKYQIFAINSCWEKCDEKYLGRTDRQTEVKQYTPPPPSGSGGIINHQSESSNWQTLSNNVVSSDYIGRCELNNQKITATMSRRVSEADQQANIGAGKYNYNLNFSRKSTKKCNYIFSCYNWICYYTIFL